MTAILNFIFIAPLVSNNGLHSKTAKPIELAGKHQYADYYKQDAAQDGNQYQVAVDPFPEGNYSTPGNSYNKKGYAHAQGIYCQQGCALYIFLGVRCDTQYGPQNGTDAGCPAESECSSDQHRAEISGIAGALHVHPFFVVQPGDFKGGYEENAEEDNYNAGDDA